MKKGRKDLKQGASKQDERQSIAQVVSLRGSNQIEIVDAKEENSLALFNFPESMCIRRAVTQQERSRKRRRGRERGMCGIPVDLLTEILVRLPAKSMVRFKCISKQWSSLIACRYFCNRLFTVTRQQQPHLYMCLVDEGGQRVLLPISSTSPDNTCYVVDQDLSIPGMGGFFLNVIRGFVCFSVRKKACIYNPTTRQLLTLPAIKSDIIAQQGQTKDTMVRFKCVSKQWSSLISCRYFCNRVLATVTRQQPRLYMCLVDEDDSQRVLLSISSTSPDNTCYVVDQDLSIPGMGGFFLNVARGLMCFSRIEKACIYNPSTKQLLTLPAIKSDIIAQQGQEKHHVRYYYIGHDPVSDQYKLVCTIAISSPRPRLANLKSEHWVFALEAGGSWKKVVPLENYRHHAPSPLGRSTSGSVVHYMAWPDNYNCVVVSFDIRSEQLTIIPVPREIAVHEDVPAVTMKADLIEYGGKIAIFYHTYLKYMSSAALWILEDSVKNEWSNQNLVLQPPQRHLVQDIELIVRGTTQDGKVILAPVKMHSRFYVLYYDLQSNDLRKVEIKGVPSLWLDKRCYFDLNYMDESESVIYLET